ncbi:hypothetical protein VNO77_04108 [Canavalia gladiata]|uniref:Uncharacterized protein n=1 Tax=Canavalia gladiata TaxID=3824 RepID=A0AAN9MWS6_CANGL
MSVVPTLDATPSIFMGERNVMIYGKNLVHVYEREKSRKRVNGMKSAWYGRNVVHLSPYILDTLGMGTTKDKRNFLVKTRDEKKYGSVTKSKDCSHFQKMLSLPLMELEGPGNLEA